MNIGNDLDCDFLCDVSNHAVDEDDGACMSENGRQGSTPTAEGNRP